MNSFQITVLTIFVILAILILVVFGVMLNSKKDADSEYPASYSKCPDYWDVSGNACIFPTNGLNKGTDAKWSSAPYPTTATNGLYDSSKRSVVFDEKNTQWQAYASSVGLPYRCALKKWANDGSVVWDGITNYNSAFC